MMGRISNGKWWCEKLFKHQLPLGFLLAIIIGLSFPEIGKWTSGLTIGEYKAVQPICIMLVFIISGLTIEGDDMKRAIHYWPAILWGVISILGLTPLLSFVLIRLPFSKEFATGLVVFAACPTSINSGISLIQIAKGNVALALVLTVLSNFISPFTLPFILKKAISTISNVSLNALDMLVTLSLQVIGPLFIGILIVFFFPRLKQCVKANRRVLSVISNFCIIALVWQTISNSAERVLQESLLIIFYLAIAGMVLHLVLLLFNLGPYYMLLRKDLIGLHEFKSGWIISSQKALAISITLVNQLDYPKESKGLIAIPCVICHLCQLFFDAWLCGKLAGWEGYKKKTIVVPIEGVALEDELPVSPGVDINSHMESPLATAFSIPIDHQSENFS